MSLLSELREARTGSAQVAYQEFALHTGKSGDGLFCFFEGKGGTDNPYYVPRIKRFIQEYHPILCGGKETVLKVHELIAVHPEYDKYKKAFFVDKDFDEPLRPHNPPIFETPYYSVENFYVSKNVFGEILKNVLQVPKISEDYGLCMSLFSDRQKEFHDATILFNSWYACLVDVRNKEQKIIRVNLKKKLPDDFVKFSLEKIESNYNIDRIEANFPIDIKISEQVLIEKIEKFSSCECYKIFRGKFEMQFLLTLFELLIQDSFNEKKYIKNKVNFSFGAKISNDQAISIFSAYAETPDSLMSYLAQVVS